MKYSYATNCVQQTSAEPLWDMIDGALEITYKTFMKHVNRSEMAELFPTYGWYCDDSKDLLRIKNDFCVSYYRSKFKGFKCYYVSHSSIEYIFLEEPMQVYVNDNFLLSYKET